MVNAYAICIDNFGNFDVGGDIMTAILRVYSQQDNWLKISNSQQNCVNGRYTIPVIRATVIAKSLNVRIGPGQLYPKKF